jgi:tetratricopeptide (TPR) repeat protein
MDLFGEDAKRPTREDAFALVGEERFEEALTVARDLVSAEPSDPSLHVLLGICLSQTGHGREAEKAFFEALRLDPDHQRAFYNLAVHYAQHDDYERASEYAKRALALDMHHQATHELIEWIREASNEAEPTPEASEPETEPQRPRIPEEQEPWPDGKSERRAKPRAEAAMAGGLVAEGVQPLRPRLGRGWTVAGWAIAIGGLALQVPIVMYSFQAAAAMLAENPNMGFNEVMANAERSQASQPSWFPQVSFLLIVLSFASLFWVTVDVRDRAARPAWSMVQMAATLCACAGCGVAAWLMVPLYMLLGRPR